MPFTSWRGTLGLIKPTHRPGSLEETIRLLPEGIGVVPVTIGFKAGTAREFEDGLPAIEAKVRELADIGVRDRQHTFASQFCGDRSDFFGGEPAGEQCEQGDVVLLRNSLRVAGPQPVNDRAEERGQ